MTDLYRELFRPQYHLTPPSGPMSDPNGMVYYEGEYHQFYQFTGRWGHAISTDLIHWEHLPLALVTDELGDIWSGSCVVDWKDSSGLFGGGTGLVAIFTHFKAGLQTQSIAFSSDRGRSWTKYAGNPVIPNPGLKDFRDPKVLWHEEMNRWVMAVSVDRRIYFYSSPNLIDWTFESEFGEGQGSHAAVWECPDLFRLPVEGNADQQKWVLHVSIGDNTKTDGSTAQYFVGEFDGRKFVNDDKSGADVRWTDYGQDFYAAVSYSDIPARDGRCIWLGWTSNWKYPFAGPTVPWKGGMSIPRSVSLRTAEDGTVRLSQQPLEELKQLRGEALLSGPVTVADGAAFKLDVRGRSYELIAEIAWEQAEEFGLRVRSSGEEATTIGYHAATNTLFVDRTKAGMNEFISRTGEPFSFGKRFTAPRLGTSRTLTLHIFVDESIIEVFADDGMTVFTTLIYPEPDSDGIELYALGGQAEFKEVTIYPLRSIWAE